MKDNSMKPTHDEVIAYNSNKKNSPFVMTEQGHIVIDSREIIHTIATEIYDSNWDNPKELIKVRNEIMESYNQRIIAAVEMRRISGRSYEGINAAPWRLKNNNNK